MWKPDSPPPSRSPVILQLALTKQKLISLLGVVHPGALPAAHAATAVAAPAVASQSGPGLRAFASGRIGSQPAGAAAISTAVPASRSLHGGSAGFHAPGDSLDHAVSTGSGVGDGRQTGSRFPAAGSHAAAGGAGPLAAAGSSVLASLPSSRPPSGRAGASEPPRSGAGAGTARVDHLRAPAGTSDASQAHPQGHHHETHIGREAATGHSDAPAGMAGGSTRINGSRAAGHAPSASASGDDTDDAAAGGGYASSRRGGGSSTGRASSRDSNGKGGSGGYASQARQPATRVASSRSTPAHEDDGEAADAYADDNEPDEGTLDAEGADDTPAD